jgi:hypothetical protein
MMVEAKAEGMSMATAKPTTNNESKGDDDYLSHLKNL